MKWFVEDRRCGNSQGARAISYCYWSQKVIIIDRVSFLELYLHCIWADYCNRDIVLYVDDLPVCFVSHAKWSLHLSVRWTLGIICVPSCNRSLCVMHRNLFPVIPSVISTNLFIKNKKWAQVTFISLFLSVYISEWTNPEETQVI